MIAKLAEALLHSARIELDTLPPEPGDAQYRSEVAQIASACARFIEGWAA